MPYFFFLFWSCRASFLLCCPLYSFVLPCLARLVPLYLLCLGFGIEFPTGRALYPQLLVHGMLRPRAPKSYFVSVSNTPSKCPGSTSSNQGTATPNAMPFPADNLIQRCCRGCRRGPAADSQGPSLQCPTELARAVAARLVVRCPLEPAGRFGPCCRPLVG